MGTAPTHDLETISRPSYITDKGLTLLTRHNKEWNRKSEQQGEVQSHQKATCPLGTTQLLSSLGSAVR